jgi:predicted house-cleaning noncanonical NTP pyrophosphatase (MazG superfamily)
LDDFEGKTEEEIREIMEEREERSNAQILEMVRMSILGKNA